MTGRRAMAFAVGAAGFAATLALWRANPGAFPHAWLAALATWLGVPLGCLALILIHALTGGRWGDAIRPQLNAGASALLLLPLFLIPLALVAPALYPWLRPGGENLPNAFYLNETGALVRIIFYLLIWFGLEWRVARLLRGGDADAGLAAMAPAGLILLALSATFMSIDMLMSLEPRFASSVFGLIRMADMILFALSVSILLALGGESVEREALQQLGRLLIASVILWAYLAFMELLIVWQSNLPDEAGWYAPRLSGRWSGVAAFVVASRFVLPFFVLLSQNARSSPRAMRIVSALLIAGACADNLWLVGPQSRADSAMLAATYIAALAGMSATSLGLPRSRRVADLRSSRI